MEMSRGKRQSGHDLFTISFSGDEITSEFSFQRTLKCNFQIYAWHVAFQVTLPEKRKQVLFRTAGSLDS